MIVEINLNNNNLSISFNNEVKSLIKIQLTTIYSFIKNNELENVYEKRFSFNELLEIKDYLEKNKYEIIFSNNIEKSIIDYNEKKIKFDEKIASLKKINKKFNKEDVRNYIKSLPSLKRPLLDHQEKSSYHLYKAESAANFSVPGSGKTSVVLSYYKKLKNENKVDGIFVIGPKVCFESWNNEFKLTLGYDPNITKLSPPLTVKKRDKFYNSHLRSELVACHFMLVANDISKLINYFKSYRLLLVIDEAHNIKKISGTWATSILSLGKYSNYKVILTGTPMPNEFRDFFNYLDFLYGDNQILNAYDKAKIEVLIKNKKNDEAINLLESKINPFFIRVTKKDLKLTKPNFNKPIIIKMNPIEEKIYQAIVTKIKDFDDHNYNLNIELIHKLRRAKIIRLMQVCSYIKNLSDPLSNSDQARDFDFNDIDKSEKLIDDNLRSLIVGYDEIEKPAKIDQLLRMVNKLVLENKKTLIWSNHLKTIDMIKNNILREGYHVRVITGSTSDEERHEIANDFNDQDSLLNCIVANPKACSESISLHKACQNAIYYDQNFNTAEFLQSLDRIHRVGGSEAKSVYYDFLQYEDTVDQRIYKRVREKADQQMRVIESDNLIFSPDDDGDDWDELFNELSK